jgi:dCTP deaminase
VVLSDLEIIDRCVWGGRAVDNPLISPFDIKLVQPASYDVCLGNDFKIFERDATVAIDIADPADITKHVHVDDGAYFLLHPGEFALGVTRERVHMPDDLVSRIEGKSSLGRLGLAVHITAGYIDPGFRGPITLEMACHHPLPIMLRPGKEIAQLSFHKMSQPAHKPYRGRYQDADTVEASRYGDKFNAHGVPLPPEPFAIEDIETPFG